LAAARTGPLQWSEGVHFLTILWSAFFGAFGWPDIWLPTWAYGLNGLEHGGGLVVARLSLWRALVFRLAR